MVQIHAPLSDGERTRDGFRQRVVDRTIPSPSGPCVGCPWAWPRSPRRPRPPHSRPVGTHWRRPVRPEVGSPARAPPAAGEGAGGAPAEGTPAEPGRARAPGGGGGGGGGGAGGGGRRGGRGGGGAGGGGSVRGRGPGAKASGPR